MDYGVDDTNNNAGSAPNGTKVKQEIPDSKLDNRLQALVQLICDVKSMEDAVMEMKYDARKAPLGEKNKKTRK